MYKKLFFLFLTLLTLKVFSQEKKEDKTLFIKSADQISYSQEKDGAGYNQAHLFGNVFIVYENYKIYADQLIIKFLKNDPKEIIASGNIVIETESSIVVGEKFFFYPESKKGLIYHAATYNKPYFIRGEYFKFVGEEKLIIDNMDFTTCDFKNPHYAIGASKSWIYKDDKDMFLGFQIKAGQDPIFYFPFMYRSYYGTGLITSLGQENGVGWFINNTYSTKGSGYDLKIMLDHYQKTGEYLGVQGSFNFFGTLNVKSALVYDRHVKYEGDIFKNFFVEVPGEDPVSGRSVRYKIDVSYEKQLLSGNDNPLGLSLSVKGNLYEPTDPFLTSQYESRRIETFDIKSILFPETSPSSMAGNFSAGSGEGRKTGFSINGGILGFSFGVLGNWTYTMSKTTNPDKAHNPYVPQYYENYKSSIIFPSITLSRSFSLFNLGPLLSQTPDKEQDPKNFIKVEWPWSLSFSGSYVDTQSYNLNEKISDIQDSKADLNLSFPFSFQWQFLTFRTPFSIANSNTFSQSKSYTLKEINADTFKRQHQFQLASPPSLELAFENISFSSSMPFNQSYQYAFQETKNPTPLQRESDRNNTYLLKTTSLGTDNQLGFLKDYEYLETSLQAKMTYSESGKSGKDLPELQKIKSKNYQYLLGFTTLKTSFNFSTSTDLSDNVLVENQKKPYTFSVNSQLIPYFTFQNTYIYDRYHHKAVSNSFSVNGSIKTKQNLFLGLWINSLSFSLNWFKSYQQERNHYLTYQFSIDFNITDEWQFSLVSSGKNHELYRYTSVAPKSQRKGFFDDLVKSLNFFSIEDRQETSFKMNSFGLNIKHDLHKWSMELTSSFAPKIERNGAFYFESSFSFQLVIKEFPSLSPPQIKKTFGGDE